MATPRVAEVGWGMEDSPMPLMQINLHFWLKKTTRKITLPLHGFYRMTMDVAGR